MTCTNIFHLLFLNFLDYLAFSLTYHDQVLNSLISPDLSDLSQSWNISWQNTFWFPQKIIYQILLTLKNTDNFLLENMNYNLNVKSMYESFSKKVPIFIVKINGGMNYFFHLLWIFHENYFDNPLSLLDLLTYLSYTPP